MVVVAADLLALTVLTPPGEMGADVVVGSAQRFGVPMMFGGPHAGYMATREANKRTLPGRLVGVSHDTEGRMALRSGSPDPRAAHPPREGHIQHLHRAGPAGDHRRHVRRVARPRRCALDRLAGPSADLGAGGRSARRRHRSRQRHVVRHPHATGSRAGPKRSSPPPRTGASTCGSLTTTPLPCRSIRRPRLPPSTRSWSHVSSTFVWPTSPPAAAEGLPAELRRTSEFMTHPVFHSYRSETEMLRYLRRSRTRTSPSTVR